MEQVWGAATSAGRRRPINEDSYLAALPIFVVADGMGGHQRGDLASAIAIDEFASLAERSVILPQDIDVCFRNAAHRLRDALTEGVGGTTVCGVALSLQDGVPYWLIFNLGDSRVYRLSTAKHIMEQVSVDHSVVQELLEAGVVDREGATRHRERHVITKALETVSVPEPDYWMIPIEQGDEILLCSDGLCDELSDQDIAQAWASGTGPQDSATRLVEAAVTAGGKDNVTAVVVSAQAVGFVTDGVSETTASMVRVERAGETHVDLHGSLENTSPRTSRS